MSDPVEMFDVLSPYSYQAGDESKTAWSDVGVAFRNKSGKGFSILIRPNLSVSGRLVVMPRQAREAMRDTPAGPSGGPPRFDYSPGAVDNEDLI